MATDIRSDKTRACENATCPHSVGSACAWGSIDDVTACPARQPKAAPVPVGVCLNHGCAGQHANHCFNDGSHFDPTRCTSRVTAEPASGPIALGDKWRGWKLEWDGWSRSVHVSNKTGTFGWRPTATMPFAPELCNALKEAYRRAVVAKLPGAVWPAEFLPWANEEIPEHWNNPAEMVYLGGQFGARHHWPMDAKQHGEELATESRLRAALLGLCDAKPVPIDVETTMPICPTLKLKNENTQRLVDLAKRDEAQLAAANTEIERLTRDRDGLQKTVNEQGALIVEQRSEIERLKGIIEYNNRGTATVLASLREENRRLTKSLHAGCANCAVVEQLRADAHRTRDILADLAKGSQ